MTTNPIEKEMLAQLADLEAMQKTAELYAEKFASLPPAGTSAALCAIHEYLYSEVMPDAGKWRTAESYNSSILRYVKATFIPVVVPIVEEMPQKSLNEIVDKFLEMLLIHPFADGNGHALRIWLDQMLANALGKRIRWDNIRYSHYLYALRMSASNKQFIYSLLAANLADSSCQCRPAFATRDLLLHYEGQAVCHCVCEQNKAHGDSINDGFVDLHIRIPLSETALDLRNDESRKLNIYIDGLLHND